MVSNLSKFLSQLGSNPQDFGITAVKSVAFNAAIEQSMASANLTEDEKAVVRSGDPASIRKAISSSNLEGPSEFFTPTDPTDPPNLRIAG